MPRGNGARVAAQNLTVQSRGRADPHEGDAAWLPMIDLTRLIESKVLTGAWPSNLRDRELRMYVRQEGVDILSGVLSQIQMRCTAFPWSVTVDENAVKDGKLSTSEEKLERMVELYQTLLQEADLGNGWDYFLERCVEDYHVPDKGLFIELIGPGEDKTKLLPRVDGLAWLDSLCCWLTGARDYPVAYYDRESKGWHKLHWSRVVHLPNMPSTFVEHGGWGFSAVSRVLTGAEILRMVGGYKRQKLRAAPSPGFAIMRNLNRLQLEEMIESHELELDAEDLDLYNKILFYTSQDPEFEAGVDLVEFQNADWFNQSDEYNTYVNIVALAFGLDPQDIWPLAGGQLGTGQQSEVLHQKGRAKGVATFMRKIEKLINQRVLPDGLRFTVETQDVVEKKERAALDQLHIQNMRELIITQVITPGRAGAKLVEYGVLDAEDLEPDEGDAVVGRDVENTPQDVSPDGEQTVPPTNGEAEEEAATAEKTLNWVEATKQYLIDFETGKIRALHTVVKAVGEYAAIRSSYLRRLQDLVNWAVEGRIISTGTYIDLHQEAVSDHFPRAYLAGLNAGGIQAGSMMDPEIADEERRRIFFETGREREFVPKFADDLFVSVANARYGQDPDALEAVRDRFLQRIEMWAVSLDHIYNLGQVSATGNKMLDWTLGPTEHCDTCVAASLQVHRASTWLQAGVMTGSKNLMCGGWKCQCQQRPTDQKAKGDIRSIPLYKPSAGFQTAGGDLARWFFRDWYGRNLRDRAAMLVKVLSGASGGADEAA